MTEKLRQRAEELSRKAAHAEPMPDGLSQPEQLYFQTMAALYKQHKLGSIDTEQAKTEKKQAMQALDEGMFAYKMHLEHAARLNVFTHEYHKSGTACRGRDCKLYNILTGLMKE